jgi:hypothetical protein
VPGLSKEPLAVVSCTSIDLSAGSPGTPMLRLHGAVPIGLAHGWSLSTAQVPQCMRQSPLGCMALQHHLIPNGLDGPSVQPRYPMLWLHGAVPIGLDGPSAQPFIPEEKLRSTSITSSCAGSGRLE